MAARIYVTDEMLIRVHGGKRLKWDLGETDQDLPVVYARAQRSRGWDRGVVYVVYVSGYVFRGQDEGLRQHNCAFVV